MKKRYRITALMLAFIIAFPYPIHADDLAYDMLVWEKYAAEIYGTAQAPVTELTKAKVLYIADLYKAKGIEFAAASGALTAAQKFWQALSTDNMQYLTNCILQAVQQNSNWIVEVPDAIWGCLTTTIYDQTVQYITKTDKLEKAEFAGAPSGSYNLGTKILLNPANPVEYRYIGFYPSGSVAVGLIQNGKDYGFVSQPLYNDRGIIPRDACMLLHPNGNTYAFITYWDIYENLQVLYHENYGRLFPYPEIDIKSANFNYASPSYDYADPDSGYRGVVIPDANPYSPGDFLNLPQPEVITSVQPEPAINPEPDPNPNPNPEPEPWPDPNPNPDVNPDTPFNPEDSLPKTKLPSMITRKFPFSIPWDLQYVFTSLRATPEAPVFRIPWTVRGVTYTWEIDMSMFNPLATIIRWALLIIFNLFLIIATRKLIGAGE